MKQEELIAKAIERALAAEVYLNRYLPNNARDYVESSEQELGRKRL